MTGEEIRYYRRLKGMTQKELAEQFNIASIKSDKKIFELSKREQFMELMKKWRDNGKTIVTTNGCFDILHRGHFELLNKASSYGDYLVVLVNSDESIKRLKGKDRPINSENDRAFALASLECVDAVVIFDPLLDGRDYMEDIGDLSLDQKRMAMEAPMLILKKIMPDVHVKGGDYLVDEVPETIYAKRFVSIPFIKEYSTTKTIKRILNR